MRLRTLAALFWIGALLLTRTGSAATPPDPWPRHFEVGTAALTVYQPQVERWHGNQLAFRAAVGSLPRGEKSEHFGVVWGSARTEVDRVERQVTLKDVRLTRSSFPTLADDGASYVSALQQQLGDTSRTVSLDRLEASLAASRVQAPGGVLVRNDPPRIFISESPAILVPIGGKPVWRPVAKISFERVLDTRAALVRRTGTQAPLYLHVYDGWLSAQALDGPWTKASSVPPELDPLATELAKEGRVDLLTGGDAGPKPSLQGGVPRIFVSTEPAELIVFRGSPELEPITGTKLLRASNTTSDVLVDTRNDDHYVLLAGRWFRAASLDGPWQFVAGDHLPGDFRKIPPSSPAGLVLASVPGTPQARAARIENSIPQTATVPLENGPTFTPVYDGEPKLAPIEGTRLQYVVNAASPTIRVSDDQWYALRAAVWFVAPAAEGPWSIATSVPAEIYEIPASSPLHYVTYVQIYGSGPGVVYEGYTPGYLGTVVAADGTVVYGTGYPYDPWIGTVYYAAPATYTVEASPVYNPATGWSYGFAMGLTTAAMMDSWGYPAYYTTYYHGYGCCASASADVYGHWGNTVTSGTRTWYEKSNGTLGEKASGTYTNMRTGTTGTYSANRSVNPYTGQAQRGYDRSFDTAGGASGSVSRQGNYNAAKGKRSYSSDASVEGAGGSSVERQVQASVGAGGPSLERSTTVDDARTGQTHTFDSGSGGGDRYASADGQVLRNDGSGWQTRTADGWQRASGDSGWADAEQQARSLGQSRAQAFQAGGFSGRGDLGQRLGGGGFGARFGGGGFGDRFGEGGGFGGLRGGGFGGFRGGRR